MVSKQKCNDLEKNGNVRVFSKDKFLRTALGRERFIESAEMMLRRQKHVLSQSTTPLRVRPIPS